MDFKNVYEDDLRAESYARLEFPGTYYLAYRDLPEIIGKYAEGNNALDFGCGTGRSARFLKKLGFNVTGIDISRSMISIAENLNPGGKYYCMNLSDFAVKIPGKFDLVTAIFTFDNIPEHEKRIELLTKLNDMLNDSGKIILVDSTPLIYLNEWLSFSTIDFPENRSAKSGEKVKIIMKDVEDKRPVEDIIWFAGDYSELFNRSGLKLLEQYEPLGRPDEQIEWASEKEIAPWIIYVLGKQN